MNNIVATITINLEITGKVSRKTLIDLVEKIQKTIKEYEEEGTDAKFYNAIMNFECGEKNNMMGEKMKNILDLRCFCGLCEERTKETYNLTVSCLNCGWEGIAILRKGDKPSPLFDECPNCGCTSVLKFGKDPNLQTKREDEK